MCQKTSYFSFGVLTILVLLSCTPDKEDATPAPVDPNPIDTIPCYEGDILINPQDGCSEFGYPDIKTSIYVLPYPPGKSYSTGLTNCSSSYHAEGNGDEYAFDFDMPKNADFCAIRAGKVIEVEESHPNSYDGTPGNYVYIKHEDNTFALYYHSPPNGIIVEVGDQVEQGQIIGRTGSSGYAGYPHLHLIVVQEDTKYPFKGVPISFRNVNPRHTVLKSYFLSYTACEY